MEISGLGIGHVNTLCLLWLPVAGLDCSGKDGIQIAKVLTVYCKKEEGREKEIQPHLVNESGLKDGKGMVKDMNLQKLW